MKGRRGGAGRQRAVGWSSLLTTRDASDAGDGGGSRALSQGAVTVRSMRLLHTSDWHLGRTFHGAPLLDHQVEVLDALVAVVRDEGVDVVVVAGDVYDRQIPSVEATQVLSDVLG